MGAVRYTIIGGEVVAEKRNGARGLYVPDSLGTTRALLDNTQTQTDTFVAWPYGEVAHITGGNPTPLTFVGEQGYHTDSTSRIYVRNRVDEPQKGRWLTVDPIGFAAGDANLYRYVFNSPIELSDPTGTDLTRCQINQGNKLCQDVHGTGWHICTGSQWSHCLAACANLGGVNYCCSNNRSTPDAGKGCICMKKPTLPPASPPHTGLAPNKPRMPLNNGTSPPSWNPTPPGGLTAPPPKKKGWWPFHPPHLPLRVPHLFPPGWDVR